MPMGRTEKETQRLESLFLYFKVWVVVNEGVEWGVLRDGWRVVGMPLSCV